MKQKIFYYEDELNDDFADTIKTLHPLPKKYCYVKRNPFSKLFSFVIYRMIARPAVWAYMKIKFHHKFVGKKALCKLKSGCFLYKNHVAVAGDAFIPNTMSVKKRNYIVTGKETNSLTAILPLLRALGNIPLGQSTAQNLAMLRCMRKRIAEGASITIYPEAHIWPYYTGIRPFPDDSFSYPIKYGAPVFCFTNTYQKRKHARAPRLVTYVDGPFYPNDALPLREKRQDLRDRVHACMTERSRLSDCVVIEYRRAPM